MRNRLLFSASAAALAFAAALLSTGDASASDITISNGVGPAGIYPFGVSAFETMGEVLTSPVSGTLTSFSLSPTGGVGELFGGIGTWNGGPNPGNLSAGSPINLYQSADVPSTGVQIFTFTPNISVTAGEQYVAYLSVYGVDGAHGQAGMRGFLGTNLVPGINYLVLTGGDPRGNTNWGTLDSNFTAMFSATFAIPELSSWAMLLVGFAGLGVQAYRRATRAHP